MGNCVESVEEMNAVLRLHARARAVARACVRAPVSSSSSLDFNLAWFSRQIIRAPPRFRPFFQNKQQMVALEVAKVLTPTVYLKRKKYTLWNVLRIYD